MADEWWARLANARLTDTVCLSSSHELGHWKGSHIVILLGVSLIQTAVSLLTFTLFLYNQPLLSSFGFLPTHPNSVLGRPTIISLLLASTLFAPVSSVLHFVTNTVTRRLEYDADAFACRLGTEYAENLKGALASIHEKNLVGGVCVLITENSYPISFGRELTMAWRYVVLRL